jgi:LPS export ABC transporter protein LptC
MMRPPLAFAAAVALLAGATACGPDSQAPPTTASSIADSADQVIFGLSTHVSQEGVRQATLDADTAFMFDDATRLELREMRLTFFTTQGTQSAVLTAREGTRNTRTNEMEARGDVVLVSEDGRQLMSEQLRYDEAADQISSDSAFVSIENGRRLEGIGFRANSDLSRWQCLQACRASGTVNIPSTPGEREPPPAPLDTGPPR